MVIQKFRYTNISCIKKFVIQEFSRTQNRPVLKRAINRLSRGGLYKKFRYKGLFVFLDGFVLADGFFFNFHF